MRGEVSAQGGRRWALHGVNGSAAWGMLGSQTRSLFRSSRLADFDGILAPAPTWAAGTNTRLPLVRNLGSSRSCVRFVDSI
jgi:hypothetical protein